MPLRMLGGVSRAEVLKQIWVPCTGGTERVKVGNHVAYRVDHAADEALMEILVPHIFTSLDECYLWGIGRAALGDMKLVVNVDFAWEEEAYNFHTATDTYSFTTMGANIIVGCLLGQAILPRIVAGLNARDLLGIRAVYSADVDASNIDILGASLRWR